MATAAGGLPLVPLSSFAKESSVHASAYALASETLSKAKQANPPVSVGALRRLIEDVRVEESSLDRVARQMQSVQSATAFNWDPDVLAKQIAILNCQLFGCAVLTHSIAHQVIYWAELMKCGPQAARVAPPVHPKDNLVSHLVRVAYLLLHAYRDFSGCAAILRALTMPEVRRLRRLWNHCPARTKDMFRELVQVISPLNNYQAYHEMLRHKIEIFSRDHQRRGSAGIMIAIPWIDPHLLSIQSIITAYTAGDHFAEAMVASDSFDPVDLVLSSPGARKLAFVMSVLELCQHNSTTESIDLIEDALGLTATNSTANKRASTLKPIHLEGLRVSVIPISDLNRLAPGDPVVNHWLVSRVYLRKDQLMDESIEVEPLMHNEQIRSDSDDKTEIIIPQTPISRRPSTVILLPEEDDVPEELQEQQEDVDSSAQADILREQVRQQELRQAESDKKKREDEKNEAIERLSRLHQQEEAKKAQEELEAAAAAEEEEVARQKKIEQDLKEQQQKQFKEQQQLKEQQRLHKQQQQQQQLKEQLELEQQRQRDAEKKAAEEEKSRQEKTLVPHNKEWTGPTSDHTNPSSHDNHDNDVHGEHDNLTQDDNRGKSVAGRSIETTSSQHNSTTSKHTKKSRLSPTAPEFVPLKKTTNTMYQASKEWRQHSPVSSVKSSKRSQVIDNDDQSEEWTGYVPSNLDIKGTAGGEEEDEDEIWKGYPGPVLSNESNETSPRRGSSQSESSEPWKGYEATKMESDWEHELTLKVRENDWQGYTLETLDEDELDSSTMLNGEFEKSRQVRGRVEPNLFEKNNFRKGMGTRKNQPNPQNTKRFTP